jgi:hypothetical protein
LLGFSGACVEAAPWGTSDGAGRVGSGTSCVIDGMDVK